MQLMLALAMAFALWFVTTSVVSAQIRSGNPAIYDIVIANGRVIDPETRLDGIRHVGITAGRIAVVSPSPLRGKAVIEAKGLVVAPGFIDLHAHGQNTLSDRVQAFDGVTTALELEVGMLPVSRWYDRQANNKRVLNYGAAASWGMARVSAVERVGLDEDPSLQAFFAHFRQTQWPTRVTTGDELDRILSMTEQGLQDGALGVGLPLGYALGTGYKELLALHTLAAKYNVLTSVHVRSSGDTDPLSASQGYGEILSLALATNAQVHICHLNRTSFRDMPLAVAMIRAARERGLRVSVEAYPYSSSSVRLNTLAPDNLARAGLSYDNIEYRGQRLTEATYNELRASSPDATVILHFYELPRDQELLDMAVLFPEGLIASDGMPWMSARTGRQLDPDTWPLSEDAFSDPRSAGTFTRFLAQYVRERKRISLADAIAKASYLPAKILDVSVPAIKKKGRLQAGMDADVVIFDPATVQDRSTYERVNQTSVGMRQVLVNGTFVIRDGVLDVNAFPGQPVRRPLQGK